MLDRSAMTSFLPFGATMHPRMAEVIRSMTLLNSRSSVLAFMAAIPSSTAQPLTTGRGRFWGWNTRPPKRPVRDAPQNCRVPRSRPSLDAPLSRALYLAGLVAAACWRLSRSSLTSSDRPRSPRMRSTLAPFRSSTG